MMEIMFSIAMHTSEPINHKCMATCQVKGNSYDACLVKCKTVEKRPKKKKKA